jgi:hypothetical protein
MQYNYYLKISIPYDIIYYMLLKLIITRKSDLQWFSITELQLTFSQKYKTIQHISILIIITKNNTLIINYNIFPFSNLIQSVRERLKFGDISNSDRTRI